ncbi:MAG: Adaptive-response sensory-kinase SasA [Gemmatimonadaceae bacterium]|nr:Adaptive-response sensory-kinase SasA [Gemmatimonadaceae bacterium]
MRRGAGVVVTLGVAALLASYVLYTQRVVRELRVEALRIGQMYARVYTAQSDTATDPAVALFDLATRIRQSGVPLILTDPDGMPTAAENLPFAAAVDDPRVRAYVAVLDAENDPVIEPGMGTVHFGHTALIKGLRIIPAAQVAMLLMLLLAGVYAFRARGSAERERVWAGMARESAHQLGTPLSSLSGWIELLSERADDPLALRATQHMAGDLERLERVAHRFERIGRPPRREPVDLARTVADVATYFRARVPSLAHSVQVETTLVGIPKVDGDPVLLEWAVEALVKNAIDALAGRGGRVSLRAAERPEGAVELIVADDGPGIPRDLRRQIFEPGFSTKPSGWGIGLALARRIVEESHGGRLVLLPSEKGATFQITFPA